MDVSPVRVVIVDDHQIVVESLAALLDLDSDFSVAGTALTADEGVEVVLRTRPDVALFDVDFPGRDSFDVIPQMMKRVPSTRIAFLTAHLSDVFVSQAIRMDVHGYLLKDEPSAEVRAAIKRLHAGEYVFSGAVRDRLAWDSVSGRYTVRADNMLCGLSVQQLSILRHLARGESVKEIARVLGRSEKSIDSHKYRIMHRLGIHDRVELCRYAIREGLTVV
ncbi:MAG: response regulator transcription factor [Rhodopirellula sp.]|nr:response regulator transcription factor [Rhodopirellula sp.]